MSPKGYFCDICGSKKKKKELRPSSVDLNQRLCFSCEYEEKKGVDKENIHQQLSQGNSTFTSTFQPLDMITSPTNSQGSETQECTSSNLQVPFPRPIFSHKKCMVCGRFDTRHRLCSETRLRIFLQTGIMVPEGSRCCSKHLSGGVLINDEANKISIIENSTVSFKEMKTLLFQLRDMHNTNIQMGLNFDNPNTMTDKDYKRLTGLSKEQFNDLIEHIQDVRNTKHRSINTCVGLLLTKLRTGLSLSVLSTLFCMEKQYVSKAIATARNSLMRNFVDNNLGVGHINRDEVIKKHTTDLSKQLCNAGENSCILIADGTYMYIQKSSNYKFQRRCYSTHKGRPLVKPMMLVSSTGYIIDVIGPFYADGKNNDANIMAAILKANANCLFSWLKPNDIFIVDRGFRDCLGLLEELGFIYKMPHFLSKGQQHSMEEANESRLITKMRWVVEAVNGLIKTWRALDHVFPNSQIPFIGDYVRIVCALCNRYRPARVKSHDDDLLVANRMLTLAKMSNPLQKKAIENNWSQKTANWVNINSVEIDFPQLTVDELRGITIGIYQLKQAKSYTVEHVDGDGMYELFFF
ncbi:uncharacterized protein LOC135840599 [Planococcus citri]|uniref:uncharacterized protein LOC135840599 n=1 Tax=Planococcus citri TaxID=170843 RepID=UPI0031F91ADC